MRFFADEVRSGSAELRIHSLQSGRLLAFASGTRFGPSVPCCVFLVLPFVFVFFGGGGVCFGFIVLSSFSWRTGVFVFVFVFFLFWGGVGGGGFPAGSLFLRFGKGRLSANVEGPDPI